MNRDKIMEYLKAAFDKYKYILMICLVGLALVCFPSSGDRAESGENQVYQADIEHLETKLEDILSKADGVGRVKVVLTAKSSSQSVYAFNEERNMTRSKNSQTADSHRSLVSIGSSGSQEPVTLRVDEPEYRGAFIVCDGASSSRVRLEITQAVSSLTGISTDNIVISKMK